MTDPATNRRGVDPPDANRDPITGEAGSHPIGTGVGAAGGAAAGAAVGGAVGGPAGALVGGAVGAVAGGAAGHAVGEGLDPTVEASYWRQNYRNRPYYEPGSDFSDYEPAYRYGWESATRDELPRTPLRRGRERSRTGMGKEPGLASLSLRLESRTRRDARRMGSSEGWSLNLPSACHNRVIG